MNELIRTLNGEIVINDLIVKKMKYEINMLFYEYPSRDKAAILAKKINNQLNASLKGLSEEDKESIRKLLVLNSFLVLPNPASDHINYGHVFTTLTNYDDETLHTKERLVKWLDDNTKISYHDASLTQYIKHYKINNSDKIIRTAASTYEPNFDKRTVSDERKDKMDVNSTTYPYRLKKQVFWLPLSILILLIVFSMTNTGLYESKTSQMSFIKPELYDDALIETMGVLLKDVHKVNIRIIPEVYRYTPWHLKSVYTYLESKNSKLIEKDYLTTIETLSEKYYINPLLLLAIIGQEQGFVPADNTDANEIINNPYNVFVSWKKYNTNFEDATVICLNTINTALRNRPANTDLIDFLNDKYSEDKNWSNGVKSIYNALQSLD